MSNIIDLLCFQRPSLRGIDIYVRDTCPVRPTPYRHQTLQGRNVSSFHRSCRYVA